MPLINAEALRGECFCCRHLAGFQLCIGMVAANGGLLPVDAWTVRGFLAVHGSTSE